MVAPTIAVGLLILRLADGLIIAAHGAQKLFGWFEGPGLAKMSKGLAAQGFRPAAFWTLLAVLGEFGGGLLLALGLLTPVGAAGIVGAMVMASLKTHWKNGFWNSKRGFEFPLSLLAMAVAIGVMGPGPYSLDGALGLSYPVSPVLIFGVFALAAVLVDVVGLLISRPRAASQAG